jgi:hypothetical protein
MELDRLDVLIAAAATGFKPGSKVIAALVREGIASRISLSES